jgi:mannosyltransferase OCH1-like enzyme
MFSIPKTIYFTYKKSVPPHVFNRWKKLNPSYTIDFSLDSDCISFLNTYFTEDIANLFKMIPKGMYKADLWRICKLYIHGGVYADVDLVPYLSIDETIKDNYTFYSCLDSAENGIFQAFIISPPKNPLFLQFIHSFIKNKPWTYENGPTHDMYNCIKSNIIENSKIKSDTLYNFDTVQIPIDIGSSETNIKEINIYNFSQEHDYTFMSNNSNFTFEIRDNKLIVKQDDLTNACGWSENISIDIFINSKQSIYLFKEHVLRKKYIVSFRGKKILDSRDDNYDRNSSFKATGDVKRFEYLLSF